MQTSPRGAIAHKVILRRNFQIQKSLPLFKNVLVAHYREHDHM